MYTFKNKYRSQESRNGSTKLLTLLDGIVKVSVCSESVSNGRVSSRFSQNNFTKSITAKEKKILS